MENGIGMIEKGQKVKMLWFFVLALCSIVMVDIDTDLAVLQAGKV